MKASVISSLMKMKGAAQGGVQAVTGTRGAVDAPGCAIDAPMRWTAQRERRRMCLQSRNERRVDGSQRHCAIATL